MKGSANCCLDHVEWLRRSGPTKKYGDRAQNRRSGAPGGARAGSQRHTAPLTRRQLVTEAPFRRSAPSRMRGKKKCRRRLCACQIQGPITHACRRPMTAENVPALAALKLDCNDAAAQIGRASCRERVEISV